MTFSALEFRVLIALLSQHPFLRTHQRLYQHAHRSYQHDWSARINESTRRTTASYCDHGRARGYTHRVSTRREPTAHIHQVPFAGSRVAQPERSNSHSILDCYWTRAWVSQSRVDGRMANWGNGSLETVGAGGSMVSAL